jgi:hypothetical protein
LPFAARTEREELFFAQECLPTISARALRVGHEVDRRLHGARHECAVMSRRADWSDKTMTGLFRHCPVGGWVVRRRAFPHWHPNSLEVFASWLKAFGRSPTCSVRFQ